jgi:hypothetical protein
MFELNTVVALSKNHHRKSDDIFADLATALFIDGYDSSFLLNKNELASLFLRKVIECPFITIDKLASIMLELTHKHCQFYGYYCEENQFCYWEAMVRCLLSHLACTSVEDLGWTEWPDLRSKKDLFNYTRKNKGNEWLLTGKTSLNTDSFEECEIIE